VSLDDGAIDRANLVREDHQGVANAHVFQGHLGKLPVLLAVGH
jgi:hypothetical protein